MRVYKKSHVDILDTVLYFSLLVLAFFSQYNFKTDVIKQTAVAYTSTTIVFILLVGVIVYHVTLTIKCRKDRTLQAEVEELKEYLIQAPATTAAKVTQSIIVLPKVQHPGTKNNSDVPKTVEITTLPYQ